MRQHRMYDHRLYGVMCDAQPACELSPIVVVCERCRHQATASLSRGIQVRSGYGSGTQERSNGTGCVHERAVSANRARAAWSDSTYDCCTPVSLPHWARTADDLSDALWCRWVWRWCSRVASEQTRWRGTEEQVGWRSDGRCVCNAKLQNHRCWQGHVVRGWLYAKVNVDWLSHGFTSHSTQNRSFRRRSSHPIS